ncbi:MAG: LacI family DNA-binding transcriptional regulator [Gammaproteobacteria bacterium]|nr:LacI family DNA-binding transcriptional regulator [Gammaproteobacteria bacterium]MDH3767797.1 LacI family DNA-binding transcriptional regulator [Gammaproteobacteria bacterium]
MSEIKKATINDVASLAGVSIKTVSRVVNGLPNVAEATRKRVNIAIERLNFRPNLSAQRLASRRSYILALLYDNPSANYLFNIQSGVLESCNARGYDLLVHPCDHTNPDLADEVINLQHQGRCDGVVLTPPLSDVRGLISALDKKGTPFIQIAPADRQENYPWVATTDEAASFEITHHLVSLGHRRIAFIRGHPDHKAMATRENGYRRALKDAGISYSRKLVAQGQNSFESGVSAANQLLKKQDPPTAIFAANDDMAAGVISAANDMGLQVPKDLSVAGFDDTPIATQTWPALTTVRQPIREMAQSAARILIERLDSQDKPQLKEIIDARLIVRLSTGTVNAVLRQ